MFCLFIFPVWFLRENHLNHFVYAQYCDEQTVWPLITLFFTYGSYVIEGTSPGISAIQGWFRFILIFFYIKNLFFPGQQWIMVYQQAWIGTSSKCLIFFIHISGIKIKDLHKFKCKIGRNVCASKTRFSFHSFVCAEGQGSWSGVTLEIDKNHTHKYYLMIRSLLLLQ